MYRWTAFEQDPRIDPSDGRVLSEFSGAIAETVPTLKGQSYSELTLGYERQVGGNLKLGLRGVYRTLINAVEDGFSWMIDDFTYGNPGKYTLYMYAPAVRDYRAVELTAERAFGRNLRLVGSYVWSRVEGNYGGLFNAEYETRSPMNEAFDEVGLLENAYGVLPQDRTHVLKLATSYVFDFGLALGGRFLWATGTPLSVLGGSSTPPYYSFLSERGSEGRTPNLWDLDLRVSYELGRGPSGGGRARLILDLLNVGNPRAPVDYDQLRFLTLDEDGNQTDPNPAYDEPTRYQPPMTLRLGLELGL